MTERERPASVPERSGARVFESTAHGCAAPSAGHSGRKPEVLAPCGSPESVKAALCGGADAVYLGYGSFNARRNAKNFTLGEVKEAVDRCHQAGTAVHAALNTLVFPDEMSAALHDAEDLAACGVDAFIVQDTGLAGEIFRRIPEIPLHASTQMSVHNPAGARLLYESGMSRIVLARELSGREIGEISRSVPDAELEVFVHGALCMSVSGQCYFSAMLGGRSGNRGLCAQTCRLPFSCAGRENVLSLKDLSLTERIKELSDAGVTSLKIEGRMKRPEYVAIATLAVRRAVDGLPADPEINSLLEEVFSRSGFTDGYFTEERGSRMFGVRRKEDAQPGKRVNERINGLTRGVYPKHPADVSLELKKGGRAKLTCTDLAFNNTVTVYGDVPEEAERSAGAERLAEAAAKTGGTGYFVRNVSAKVPPDLFLPVSAVNSMRREAFEKLAELRAKSLKAGSPRTERPSSEPEPCLPARIVKAVPEYEIRAESFSRLPDFLPEGAAVTVPSAAAEAERETAERLASMGYSVSAELPRLMFGERDEEREYRRLAVLREYGVTRAVCGNIGHIPVAKSAGMELAGGFGLNVSNPGAAAFFMRAGLREVTASAELSATGLRGLTANAPCGVRAFAYGRLPVMLVRNCPMSGARGCADCVSRGHGGDITDRKGEKFPVVCRKGYGEILNSRPLYMGDKKRDIINAGAKGFLIYFTGESAARAGEVMEMFISGTPFDGKFTRGLYYRGTADV